VVWNTSASEYLVVWDGDDGAGDMVKDEIEVFGQRLDAAGAEVGDNDFRLSDMGPDGDAFFGAFSPAVAHSGTAHESLVVWFGDDNTAPLIDQELEIFGQRFESEVMFTGPSGISLE
jgi:hypothetical protein